MPKSVKLTNKIKSFDEKMIIKDDDLFIEFLHTGGHTIGSSIAFFPHERVLFGGDLFVTYGFNFNIPLLTFYQNKGRKTGNPDEYINAYEKFRSMEIDFIIPGHGSVLMKPQEEVKILLSSLKTLRTLFTNVLENKKELKDIDLSNIDMIKREFYRINKLQANKQNNAKKALEKYINLLKTSLNNYYIKNS
ncbi:MAG: MBL fold metallo-hydrolase [Candidatus Hodarchaeales archaeon]|jgi:glyoxylase-like metal-dependent hydrolase (beta-lactamase superfamily II)